eukprot:gene3748-4667_t
MMETVTATNNNNNNHIEMKSSNNKKKNNNKTKRSKSKRELKKSNEQQQQQLSPVSKSISNNSNLYNDNIKFELSKDDTPFTKSTLNNLLLLLQNPTTRRIFIDFTEKEHSHNHVLFWQETVEFKDKFIVINDEDGGKPEQQDKSIEKEKENENEKIINNSTSTSTNNLMIPHVASSSSTTSSTRSISPDDAAAINNSNNNLLLLNNSTSTTTTSNTVEENNNDKQEQQQQENQEIPTSTITESQPSCNIENTTTTSQSVPSDISSPLQTPIDQEKQQQQDEILNGAGNGNSIELNNSNSNSNSSPTTTTTPNLSNIQLVNNINNNNESNNNLSIISGGANRVSRESSNNIHDDDDSADESSDQQKINIKNSMYIFEKYLAPDSKLEVNLDFKTFIEIKKKIDSQAISATIFEKAQKEIFEVIYNDSYFRFKSSTTFQTLLSCTDHTQLSSSSSTTSQPSSPSLQTSNSSNITQSLSIHSSISQPSSPSTQNNNSKRKFKRFGRPQTQNLDQFDPLKPERLQKVLARAGVTSRRNAEILISEGKVTVNGNVATMDNLMVSPDCEIKVEGKPIKIETPKIWIHFKETQTMVSEFDPKGEDKKCLIPILKKVLDRTHLIPVGRLDYYSEGLLLLTNDGELARHLSLPSNNFQRTYRVRLFGKVTQEMMRALTKGIIIDNIKYKPIELSVESETESNSWVKVVLKEGKNREVRKIFEHFNVKVLRLIRVSYGPYSLDDFALQHGETMLVPIKQELLPFIKFFNQKKKFIKQQQQNQNINDNDNNNDNNSNSSKI